jgi:hypothetical protein
MDVTDKEWERFDWIILARDRYKLRAVVNTVMNIRVASNAGSVLTSLMWSITANSITNLIPVKFEVLKDMTINYCLVRRDAVRSGIRGFKMGLR